MTARGQLVNLANWQDPPFNRWGFLHVDQILPTVSISRSGSRAEPFGPADPDGTARRPILGLPVVRTSGESGFVANVLRDTETDAFLMLHRGLLVHESYPTMAADSRHLLMSVTKSFVGAVTGILAERGV